MWVKASGELTDHVTQINTAVSSHILISGDDVALVDASLWSVREELWSRIAEEVETIEYLLLTHMHFDHLGALPFLRSKAPHLKLVTGRETATLLGDKEILSRIAKKNSEASAAVGDSCDVTMEEWKEVLTPDLVFNEGEILKLGDGVEVKLIETPGHSSDSVSYYVKPDLTLAVGDAFGAYGGRDLVTPSFNDSLSDFMASLQKISALEIQILAFPHGGSLTGDMVGKYIVDLARESENFKNMILERVGAGEVIEEISSSIVMEWVSEGRFPDGPFNDSMKLAVEGMIRAVNKLKE